MNPTNNKIVVGWDVVFDKKSINLMAIKNEEDCKLTNRNDDTYVDGARATENYICHYAHTVGLPRNFSEAHKSPDYIQWNSAINDELEAIEKN